MNRRKKIEGKRRKNYCCGFVLPMVNVSYKNLPSNFINAYIIKDYEIVTVFDKTVDYDIIFYTYLTNLKERSTDLLEVIDEEDEVVLRFKIPEVHKENFDQFINGKYSRFSESYKKTLVSYFGQKSIKDGYLVTEYNVIYPQDFKRLQIAERLYDRLEARQGLKLIDEVLDLPNLEIETFKPIQQLTQSDINKQSETKYDGVL